MTIPVLIGTVIVIIQDVQRKDVFKFSAFAAASEFCEWVQIYIYIYIPQCNYQVKHYSFPWFSSACAAARVHRNHFFACTKRINVLSLK